MFTIPENFTLPEICFELSADLGVSELEATEIRWQKLKNEVLDCYKVKRMDRLEALLTWFYQKQGFGQAQDDYFSLSAIDLSSVMQHKQGHAVPLALLVQALAVELDLRVELLLLPVDVVIAFSEGNTTHYFSPHTGEPLSLHYVHCLIRAEEGNLIPNDHDYFLSASDDELLLRWLADIKAIALIEKSYEICFAVCNLLVDWQGRLPHWVRERAFVAQQLGCVTFASTELEALIEDEPEDPLQDLMRFRLYEMKHQHNVYH
jgi:regulator of sirC expression with transglutaminase-like and TPR domain